MGYLNFRLQFTIENYQETKKIIHAYKQLVTYQNKDEVTKLVDENKEKQLYTRGFFNKDIE